MHGCNLFARPVFMNMLIAGGRSYSGWTLNVCCSADAAWLKSESGGLFLPSVAASVSRTGASVFLNERPLRGEEKDPPQVKITPASMFPTSATRLIHPHTFLTPFF